MTKRQKKQAIGIVVMLLVLLAALLGLKLYNKNANENKAQEEEAAKIYVTSAEAGAITEFSWQQEGQTLTMTKDGDIWSCKEHPEYVIDADKVETLLENIAPLEAEQVVDDPEADEVYGFDVPANVISYTAGEDTITLTVGMENEITGGYYLKSSADGIVYLVDGSLVSAFNIDASELEKEEDGESSEASGASEISETSEASETAENSEISDASEVADTDTVSETDVE